jgi:hypothetical protein
MLLGGMVMTHETHHQQMRQWAEQDHAVEQHIVQRHFEERNQHYSYNRD